ncbi:MAG: OB-fold-containig protein, partial [Methylocystis sp.]
MIELFLQANNLPFSVAIALMLLLALVQLSGLADVIGGDADVDVSAPAAIDAGLLSLVGLGRLPLLMWLMMFLTSFGLVGLAGQQLVAALAGSALNAWVAASAAALIALPLTAVLARPLARIMPRDETTAIHVNALVGHEAEIVIGRAATNSPARARVVDGFGQTHYVMVEPDDAGQSFSQGERILLVRF